jgi:hypothetical protein
MGFANRLSTSTASSRYRREGKICSLNRVGLADVAWMELAESGENKPADLGYATASFR